MGKKSRKTDPKPAPSEIETIYTAGCLKQALEQIPDAMKLSVEGWPGIKLSLETDGDGDYLQIIGQC